MVDLVETKENLQKENLKLKEEIVELKEKLEKCRKEVESQMKYEDILRKDVERMLFWGSCK